MKKEQLFISFIKQYVLPLLVVDLLYLWREIIISQKGVCCVKSGVIEAGIFKRG